LTAFSRVRDATSAEPNCHEQTRFGGDHGLAIEQMRNSAFSVKHSGDTAQRLARWLLLAVQILRLLLGCATTALLPVGNGA
jgi:hypothetical protein